MLNANQYQQLMSMLSNHLTTSTKASSVTENPSTSYATSICFLVSLNPILSSSKIWIVDSGATVFFAGIVKLNDGLVLRDVLFLPQFKFNLLSVSALAKDSSLTVSFFSDCCLVYDHSNKRMIVAHRTKFEPRAKVCVFLGYPYGMKGYKLFDITTQQIFISRDVVFHEKYFPFHHVTFIDGLVDPFPDLVLPLSTSDASPPFSSAHVPVLHDQLVFQEFDT
ncbi:hypothetical protein LWI28_009587 [Acer negundo]|uniref:Retroviral polymerase SH3-like domain-containing protein n=1 Tax=Acer negundo TaxID=4023 RepID=A0AAD5IYB4_ACENE|nr:hypothetical protein LWI28_009587 [Acer negundo]